MFDGPPPPDDHDAPPPRSTTAKDRARSGNGKSNGNGRPNLPARRSARSAASRAIAKKGGGTIQEMLDAEQDAMAALLPSYLKPDTMLEITLAALDRDPDLLSCTPESLILSVKKSCEMGIPPDGYHGHLVKYGARAQFLPDWKGVVYAANNSPHVKKVTAGVIFAGDEFNEVHTEERDGFDHFPKRGGGTDDEVEGAWAKAHLTNGDVIFIVIWQTQIDAARAMGNKKQWDKHYQAYVKKTAYHRLLPHLPLDSRRQAEALAESEIEPVVIDGNTGEIIAEGAA